MNSAHEKLHVSYTGLTVISCSTNGIPSNMIRYENNLQQINGKMFIVVQDGVVLFETITLVVGVFSGKAKLTVCVEVGSDQILFCKCLIFSNRCCIIIQLNKT